MERTPGAASFDAELEQLGAERTHCVALRARVHALEVEREVVERALHEATGAPVPDVWGSVRAWLSDAPAQLECSEAQLDAWLARLRQIEQERRRARVELDARADVDNRFTRVIARKHAQLVSTAPDHLLCVELVGALALCATTQRALGELDAQVTLVESARDQAKLLVDLLIDANGLALIDNFVDLPVAEVLLGVAKYSRVKFARDEAERLARKLRALGELTHAAQVTGPRAPFGLGDCDVALFDALSGATDLLLSHQSFRWLDAAESCKKRLDELLGTLLRQRRRLEILMSERTQHYHALVLRA